MDQWMGYVKLYMIGCMDGMERWMDGWVRWMDGWMVWMN